MYLCYDSPAMMNYAGWEGQALPLGNGKIGAKVFGGAKCELISFNEKTLWSGGNDVPGFNYGISNPDGGEAMRRVQNLLEDGNAKAAEKAMEALQGNHVGFGAYQAFGTLYLAFDEQEDPKKYIRDLDMDSASCMVTYLTGGVTVTRHYFVSYPNNVFVGRIEAEGGVFGLDAYFVSEQRATVTSESNAIFVSGTVNANNGLNAEPGENRNSMKHAACFRFIPADGKISAADSHIIVKNCTSLVIIGSLSTDYANIFPSYCDGSDPLKKVIETVKSVEHCSFGELYRAHVNDFRPLFRRVSFNLGEEESTTPTDTMLVRFGKRYEYKRNLISTLFNYGRYLLLCSSREGSLPANLQGLWNAKNDPEWACDYHLNINLQMNYWGALVANLAETVMPFVDFIDSLRVPGRLVASKTMGIGSGEDLSQETGWVAHTMVNPLGMVAPGTSWRWGWSPASGAWAAAQLMDYYDYTGDYAVLRDKIYPIMQESALLWSQLLVEEKSGRMVVSPCFSPEHGPVSAGGTYEQSIIAALYKRVLRAGDILRDGGDADKVDTKLLKTIRAQHKRLQPLEMGGRGQIKEWAAENTFSRRGKKEGVEQEHRHISHLLSLFPFDDITHDDRIFAQAARVSLKERGFGGTPWAMVHRMGCYARLGDGKACDALVEKLLKKGLLPNLLSNHPPFQIDANLGFTAVVCEMLLQSHEDFIRLLPALPDAWPHGKVTGLVARGGAVIDLSWRDGKLTEAFVSPAHSGTIKLFYGGSVLVASDENGNEPDVSMNDKGVCSFKAEKGKRYKII